LQLFQSAPTLTVVAPPVVVEGAVFVVVEMVVALVVKGVAYLVLLIASEEVRVIVVGTVPLVALA